MANLAFHLIVLGIASSVITGCSSAKTQAETVALAVNPPGYIVEFGGYREIETRTGRWAGLEYSGKNKFGHISSECSIFQKRRGEPKWVWQGITPGPLTECMDGLWRRSLAGAD
jgi:hypothetical protein